MDILYQSWIPLLTQLAGDFNGDGVMDITAYSFSFFSGCHVQEKGIVFVAAV